MVISWKLFGVFCVSLIALAMRWLRSMVCRLRLSNSHASPRSRSSRPHTSDIRACCCLVAFTLLANCSPLAFATTLSVQETLSYFGTLNQHSLEYSYPQYGTGGGNMACGPVAGINSLVYLSNKYPSVYGPSLIHVAPGDMDNNGSHTAYDDWIYSAGASGMAKYAFMNTTLANGTWHDNFIRGMYSYIEASIAGVTQYSAQDYWSPTYWGNAPSTRPPPSWVAGQTPTWDFIYDGIAKGSAVGVLFTYNSGGGHFVSVTGMNWDSTTNSGILFFMNPWTGSAENTGIRLSSGRIKTDYGGANASWISVANSVIAVPEPSTFVCLIVASMCLALSQVLCNQRKMESVANSSPLVETSRNRHD